MKAQLIILMIFIGSVANSFGQSTFQRTLGVSSVESGMSIVQTTDGGFAICGRTGFFGAGGTDVFVVKLDSLGDLVWSKAIGGGGIDEGWSIVQTADGGFAIGGKTESIGGGDDAYLVRLDDSGNLLWTRTIDNGHLDHVRSIIQTPDGGFAMGGSTWSSPTSWDVHLIKFDSAGNFQWSKVIGEPTGITEQTGYSMIQATDGGFAICGRTASFGSGSYEVNVMKLDSSGNIQWSRAIGGVGNSLGNSIIQTFDGGFAIGGTTNGFGSGDDDVYVVKLNSSGNLQWTRTIGSGIKERGWSIVQTIDGGFAITGSINSSLGINTSSIYVVKLDSIGNLQWVNIFEGSYYESGYSIIQTTDGNIAISGETGSFGAGSSFDMYVGKININGSSLCSTGSIGMTDSGGVSMNIGNLGVVPGLGIIDSVGNISSPVLLINTSCIQVGINENSLEHDINIYPNPATAYVTILHEGIYRGEATLYNVLGQEQVRTILGRNMTTIITEGLSPGFYVVKIAIEDQQYTRNVVIGSE